LLVVCRGLADVGQVSLYGLTAVPLNRLVASLPLASVAAMAELKAGYQAVSFSASGAISGTATCPQSFVCPGGVATQAGLGKRRLVQAVNATIIPCPDGTWTKLPGATNLEQCCEYALDRHVCNFKYGIRSDCVAYLVVVRLEITARHCCYNQCGHGFDLDAVLSQHAGLNHRGGCRFAAICKTK